MSNRQYLSTTLVAADGVRTDFDFSFAGVMPDQGGGVYPYLSPEDIKAREEFLDGAGNPQIIDRQVSLIAPNRIRILGAPVAAGRTVRIFRSTEIRYPLVDYRDRQSVSEADLDLSARQALMLLQEVSDGQLGNITRDLAGNYDVRGNRIINVAPGIGPGDAVNMGQVAAWLSAAELNWRFLAPSAATPLIRDNGTPLQTGDVWFNTGDNLTYRFNGVIWIPQTLDMDALIGSNGADAVGYRARTVRKRLDDDIYVTDYITNAIDGVTDNSAGIQLALDAAFAAKRPLIWPKNAANYVANQSLTNFHGVMHEGYGVLNANGKLWYMTPIGVQANVLYVGFGADSNDGLSPDRPLELGQTAINLIQNNWADKCTTGLWRIQLSAGDHRRMGFNRRIVMGNRFQIWGEPANFAQPTTRIINHDNAVSAIGLYFNGPTHVEARDIHALGFPGSNGQGITSSADDSYFVNCWAWDCGWSGINQSPRGVIRTTGCRVLRCREGFRAYSNVTFTFGYNAQATPCYAEECTLGGIVAHNSSNGHADYVICRGNSTGTTLSNHSRCDFMGAKMIGNNVGIDAATFCTYIKNTPEDVLFNSGAPNGINERCSGGSLPNQYATTDMFVVGARQRHWGYGWSGTSASSGFKFQFHQMAGDAGLAILASGTDTSALCFGRPGLVGAGQLQYLHSADEWRILVGGAWHYSIAPGNFRPSSTTVPRSLGAPSARWSTAYLESAPIVTSDERAKTRIKEVDDRALDAWESIDFRQYQMVDAVREKGLNARWHFGVIAQKVEAAFKEHGIDAFEYGILCYDEWAAEAPEYDEDGELIHPGIKAGNRYGVRYEEAYSLEAAVARRRADRAEARIAKLEELINQLIKE